MNSRIRYLLVSTLLVAASAASSVAAPLVLVQPVSTAAFSGDATVTFSTFATAAPSPSYLWQVNTGSGWTTLAANATYSGVSSATLVITAPDSTIDGYRYRCTVSDGSTQDNTVAATLHVYGTPDLTPSLTVSPSTLSVDSTDPVTITVSGLDTGSAIYVRRVLDANANGQIDPGEPAVSDWLLEDGQAATIGGVAVPIIQGDEDGSVDGEIATRFTIPASPEVGRAAAHYLVQVSSLTGAFRPVTQPLEFTAPAYAQSIAGHVLSGGTPVPYAAVALLATTGDGEFISATVADASGAYSLPVAAAGSYFVFPVQVGFVGSFGDPVSVGAGETLTGHDVEIMPVTRTIGGAITKNASGVVSPMGAIQLFVSSDAGATVVFSNTDGVYVAGVTAGQWGLDASENYLARTGVLSIDGHPSADTSTASQTLDIEYSAATALIYGTVQTDTGTPLAGVSLYGSSSSGHSSSAITDATGHYYLLAEGSTTGTPITWSVGVDNSQPALAGYIPPTGTSADLYADQAKTVDFTATAATCWIQGHATLDGVAIPGLTVNAVPDTSSGGGGSSLTISATTDESGNYQLALDAGTWVIVIGADSIANYQVIAPIVTRTISDGQTLTGADIVGISTTSMISGTLRELNLDPVSNELIYATASIGGKSYFTAANSDNGGSYTLPVIDGSWTITIPSFGSGSQATVDVSGSPVSRDFTRPLITGFTGDLGLQSGSSGSITVYTSRTADSYRWQVSIDGSTWTDLSNDATYGGTTGTVLSILSASLDLSGNQYRVHLTYDGVDYYSTSATLTVTAVSGFDAWRQSNFTNEQLIDPEISGGGAAPAGDGVVNLLKYAFGLDPFTPAKPPGTTASAGGGTMTLTFDAMRPELTYEVQASTDLVNWSTDSISVLVAGTQRIASYSLTGKPHVFLRVVVTQP